MTTDGASGRLRQLFVEASHAKKSPARAGQSGLKPRHGGRDKKAI
jgi:hypothetical protein